MAPEGEGNEFHTLCSPAPIDATHQIGQDNPSSL